MSGHCHCPDGVLAVPEQLHIVGDGHLVGSVVSVDFVGWGLWHSGHYVAISLGASSSSICLTSAMPGVLFSNIGIASLIAAMAHCTHGVLST